MDLQWIYYLLSIISNFQNEKIKLIIQHTSAQICPGTTVYTLVDVNIFNFFVPILNRYLTYNWCLAQNNSHKV
jgi:hypothetical protein